MPAAARVNDMHNCPAQSGGVPHMGGPIIGPGIRSVMIGGQPAAVIGDSLICRGAIDTIITGSSSVLINGRNAARVGDKTAHGGTIVSGLNSVIIGG